MADGKITVDNYPLDLSVQYEQRRSTTDDGLLDDADKIRAIVSRQHFKPTDTLAVDKMFQQDEQSPPWGGVKRPDSTNHQAGQLFVTNQISPTFGPQDRLDAMSVRIEGIKKETLQKLKSLSSSATGPSQISDVENEANTLSLMISEVSKINEQIEFIHGEIARFKKA